MLQDKERGLFKKSPSWLREAWISENAIFALAFQNPENTWKI